MVKELLHMICLQEGRQFQLNVFLYSQSSQIFIRKGIINLIF